MVAGQCPLVTLPDSEKKDQDTGQILNHAGRINGQEKQFFLFSV